VTIETRAVLADAYPRGRRPPSLLTHAVEVTPEGDVARVLCGRVTVDHLADSCASDPAADPTCPRCRRALRTRR